MAYVKVSTTKNAVAALRYGEHEKDVVRGGVDCPEDTEMAIKLFAADRMMWNKDSGLQAHIVIQSFQGRECTPEEANKIGQELAKKVAPGHRAMVYTHQQSEGGNIHNHIVICSVNQNDGRKLDTHGMLWKCRIASNELTNALGLSDITERVAGLRYTQAEKGLIEKGEVSWKDEIREVVDKAKLECKSEVEFKTYLAERGITINERNSKREVGGKAWTYYTNSGRVRGSKLGNDYTRAKVLQSFSAGKQTVSAADKFTQSQEARNKVVEKGLQMAKAASTPKQNSTQGLGIASTAFGILTNDGGGLGGGKLGSDLAELLKGKTPAQIEEILEELEIDAKAEAMAANSRSMLSVILQAEAERKREEERRKRESEKNKKKSSGWWR